MSVFARRASDWALKLLAPSAGAPKKLNFHFICSPNILSTKGIHYLLLSSHRYTLEFGSFAIAGDVRSTTIHTLLLIVIKQPCRELRWTYHNGRPRGFFHAALSRQSSSRWYADSSSKIHSHSLDTFRRRPTSSTESPTHWKLSHSGCLSVALRIRGGFASSHLLPRTCSLDCR